MSGFNNIEDGTFRRRVWEMVLIELSIAIKKIDSSAVLSSEVVEMINEEDTKSELEIAYYGVINCTILSQPVEIELSRPTYVYSSALVGEEVGCILTFKSVIVIRPKLEGLPNNRWSFDCVMDDVEIDTKALVIPSPGAKNDSTFYTPIKVRGISDIALKHFYCYIIGRIQYPEL